MFVPEDGGPMVEYLALKNHVTLWNVAVERQIMVKGPDAEAFVDYVITRDATLIAPMRAKYVILCNTAGGVLNDPVLLRLSADEFWFSLADSDIGMYLQGVNHDKRFNVVIDELDVCPVQVQGKKSLALMKTLIGTQVNLDDMPYYGWQTPKWAAVIVWFRKPVFQARRVMKFICVMQPYTPKYFGTLF